MRGSEIGKNVIFHGFPLLKIKNFKNVILKSGITFEGRAVIWQNGNGKITIGENCYIGIGCILNSTSNEGSIIIGDNTLIGAYSLIQDNDHGFKKGILIKNQPFSGSPIIIGSNCWIGAHSCVLKGVSIGEGSVVGAGSVVTKDIASSTIVAGVPAKKVRCII